MLVETTKKHWSYGAVLYKEQNKSESLAKYTLLLHANLSIKYKKSDLRS